MLFWFGRFTVELIIWLLLADRSRWKEILPVCLVASYVSFIVDQICELFDLWQYIPLHPLANLVNGFGVYIVVTYLFIQWLPKQYTWYTMAAYFFVWTAVAISIEWFHIYTGHMMYGDWWNMGFSYASDWLLFWIFYKFYILHQKRCLYR